MSALASKASLGDRAFDSTSLEVREAICLFLRFESPRERFALPYASLLRLELSLDETELVLGFAGHEVRVRGLSLRPAYEAVTNATAVQMTVVRSVDQFSPSQSRTGAIVSEIRVVPMTDAERKRR